jgi:hypothetical protein
MMRLTSRLGLLGGDLDVSQLSLVDFRSCQSLLLFYRLACMSQGSFPMTNEVVRPLEFVFHQAILYIAAIRARFLHQTTSASQ